MTFQFRDTVRNGRLDAIETVGGASCSLRIYTGPQPINCLGANSGTLLAHMDLPASWLADASNGAKAIAGTWQDASADGGAGATPGHFRIYNSQVTMDGTTCIIQGSAGVGSGDLNCNGTITAGQQVTITSFTITDGNA